MALTVAQIREHVYKWKTALQRGSYAHRQHWPERLFRHEPVENVVKIIKHGALLSRNAANGLMARDIAAKDVLATSQVPHRYARLYFRPLNPTQYHVEGIRKSTEFINNDSNAHAPILVMMLFSTESVLSIPDVEFSSINMQAYSAERYSSHEEFLNLDFNKIYHDGPTQDSSVRQSRCAEVLIPNRLPLNPHLQAILCRSPAERQTLLHLAGAHGATWAEKIRVYEQPGIFQSFWAYVNSVNVTKSGVLVKCHPRRDGQTVRFDMRIRSADLSYNSSWSLENAKLDRDISALVSLDDGEYFVSIELDGYLAYEAATILSDQPF